MSANETSDVTGKQDVPKCVFYERWNMKQLVNGKIFHFA